MIKNGYPHLKYVRVHTHGKHAATIYAWDEDLQLSEQDMRSLRNFASAYLLQHVCFTVKPYHRIEEDGIPKTCELPESVIHAALSRGLNENGIVAVINGMLVDGNMTLNRYDSKTGTIHFDVWSSTPVTDIEKELIQQYLYELIPLGSSSEVSYYSSY